MLGNDDDPSNEDQRYFVKRKSGKVFGPFDKSAIRMMLKADKIGPGAAVSADKQEWNPVSSIPAFADLVELDDEDNATHMGGFAAATDAGEDEPADLPQSAEDDGGGVPLPQSKATDQEADLPRSANQKDGGAPPLPQSSEQQDDGPGLPKPTDDGSEHDDGPGLPRPKSDGDGPGLPRPKGGGDSDADGPGLPKPQSGDADGPPDLPQPKGEDSLPDEAGGDDLPASAQPDLPEAKGGESLPESKGADNLPGDTGGEDLPASAQPDLPEAKGGESIPRAKGGESLPEAKGGESLPQDAEDESFEAEPLEPGGPPPENDALSSPSADDDLFADDEDDDDLFADEQEDDDLFADDEDDDLFSEEEEELFAEENDDDLFGDEDDQDDDLFSESTGARASAAFETDDAPGGPPAGGQDDFGGGEPLDLDDQAEPNAVGGPQAGGGAPPGGGPGPTQTPQVGDGGDDLELDRSAAAAAGVSAEGAGTQQPASPGVPEQEHQEQAEASPEAEPAEAAAGGGSSTGTIAALLVVVLLAGGGAAGYFLYLGDEAEPKQNKKKTKTTDQTIDISGLEKDTYARYRGIVEGTDPATLETQSKAKLLFAQSMFLARYDDQKVRESASELAGQFEEADGGYGALGRGAWAAQQGESDRAAAYLGALRNSNDASIAYYATLLTGIAHAKALVPEGKATTEERYSESIPATAKTSPQGPHYADQSDGDSGESPEGGEADSPEAEPGSEPTGDAPSETSPDAGAPRGDAAGGGDDGSGDKKPFEAGKKALTAARESHSEIAQPDYWLGRLNEANGESVLAASYYENGVTKQQNHVASRLRLADLRYEKGNLQGAKSQVDKILSELGSAAGEVETAEAYHIEGLVHSARSESDQAIESFTKAIDKDPGRSSTLRKLAEAYEEAGNHQEALNFFQSHSSGDQQNPEILLGIVRSYMGLKQWQDAINTLERGEKKFPDDARFPYYLGRLHLERGAFSDAREAMERAVGIDDSLLDAYGSLAQLVWRLEQDPSTAEYYVQQAIDKPERIDAGVATKIAGYYRMSDQLDLAIDWYREALRRDPNAWPARLALAKIHLDEHQTDQALELLEKAKEAGVRDIRLSAYLADAYRQSEQYDRALKAISKVIDEKPENAEYIFIRGQIRFDRGNLDTARRDFNKAYEIDPLFHRAYFYVGRVASEQEDFKTALKIFRQVLDDKPKEGRYRFWMGRAFEAQDRLEDALTEYEKATDVDEEFARENPEVYIRRGRILVRLDRPEKGREEISRALEIDPDLNEARLAMAEADFTSKDYTSAIENFEKALDEDRDAPDAHHQLGMALVYEDREREGAKHLQKAIEHGYDDPEIYRTLGYLYKELNRRQLAVETFKSYLKETSDDEVPASTKREILDQIEQLGG